MILAYCLLSAENLSLLFCYNWGATSHWETAQDVLPYFFREWSMGCWRPNIIKRRAKSPLWPRGEMKRSAVNLKKLLLSFSFVFICSSPVSRFGYSGVMDSDSAGVLYRFFGPAWPPGDDTLNAGILEKGTYFSVSFRVFVKKFNFNSLFTPLFTWGIYRTSGCLKAELRCNASI